MKVTPLSEMTWKQVDGLERGNTTFLLPIASTEQHGYHLPVSTDARILTGALERLMAQGEEFRRNYVALPLMPYGISPEHLDFPGSVSLEMSTAAKFLEDVIGSLARHGFRDYIFLNTHGGNRSLLSAAGRELRIRYGCGILHADLLGAVFFAELQYLLEGKSVDIHGGEYETSVMQYLYPELVNLAFPAEDLKTDVKALTSTWMTRDLSRTGVIGDATLARPEKGKAFFTYMVGRLAEILREHEQGDAFI